MHDKLEHTVRHDKGEPQEIEQKSSEGEINSNPPIAIESNDAAKQTIKEKLKTFILKGSGVSGSTTVKFDETSTLEEIQMLPLSSVQFKLFKAQKKREDPKLSKQHEPVGWRPVFIAEYDNNNAIQNGLIYLRARFKRHWDLVKECSIPDLSSSRAEINSYLSRLHQDDPRFIAINELWSALETRLGALDLTCYSQEDVHIIGLCLEMLPERIDALAQGLIHLQDSKIINIAYHELIGIITTLIAEVIEKQPKEHPNPKNILIPPDVAKIYGESLTESTAISNIGYGTKGSDAAICALKTLNLEEYIHYSGMPQAPGVPLPQIGLTRSPSCGYFEWSTRVLRHWPAEKSDVALLSRTSETKYDLTECIDWIIKKILLWVSAHARKTKTLLFDVSLCKPTEELWDVFRNKRIRSLIQKGSLQVVVVSSDQKQQTLGTGKFAAGEYCIISNKETIQLTNRNLDESKINIDMKVAQFFRQYTQKSCEELIKKQTKNAFCLAQLLEKIFPMLDVVPNGPFVYLINTAGYDPTNKLGDVAKLICPLSFSFGFVDTCYSRWDPSKLRISVGLEDPSVLIEKIHSELSHHSTLLSPSILFK